MFFEKNIALPVCLGKSGLFFRFWGKFLDRDMDAARKIGHIYGTADFDAVEFKKIRGSFL